MSPQQLASPRSPIPPGMAMQARHLLARLANNSESFFICGPHRQKQRDRRQHRRKQRDRTWSAHSSSGTKHPPGDTDRKGDACRHRLFLRYIPDPTAIYSDVSPRRHGDAEASSNSAMLEISAYLCRRSILSSRARQRRFCLVIFSRSRKFEPRKE
jgi:hypothetical protein